GRLVWHKAYSCPTCGTNVQEDGFGDLDPESRQAILDQEGQWVLILHSSGPQAVLVLKSLRSVLGWTLDHLAELKKHLPGVVAQGTRAEMECLRTQIPRSLDAVTVKKIE